MTTDPSPAANYLLDLGDLIKENALEAKKDRDNAVDADERRFHEGRLVAYYEVALSMQNQARAFGLSLEEIGLEGISPDRDLI
jgi:hypothetical protein